MLPLLNSKSFIKEHPTLGRLTFNRLRLPEDLTLLHSWVTQPYAKYWDMQGQTLEQVERTYRHLLKTHDIYLGYRNQIATLLLEVYDPRKEPVGCHFKPQPGDAGMHILVAPPGQQQRISGYTWQMFKLAMDFLFHAPNVRRIVVEPDIRNKKIHALNRRAGFHIAKCIELPNKSAFLSFCNLPNYLKAMRENYSMNTLLSRNQVNHLKKDYWSTANRNLLAKMLSEFAHERLITPEKVSDDDSWCHYRLTPTDNVVYFFKARKLSLNHWWIDAKSISKFHHDQKASLDALQFITECQSDLPIPQDLLPTYFEEISSTLASSAFKLSKPFIKSKDLVHADYQTIEASMTEGHPSFVANNGRIGFTATDFLHYAPETGMSINLYWLAARKDRAITSTSQSLNFQQLYETTLGDKLQQFTAQVVALGQNIDDYVLIPVHPWQWENKLARVYAADIAQQHLIFLGEDKDQYQPQQSIRTFFNTTSPEKPYIKVALSILNMGFMRGLSPYYMQHTPAINDWVYELVEGDAVLSSCGFRILREIAAVGFGNQHMEAATSQSSPYRKMLSALWRESPTPYLQPPQKLMTMAALLHTDHKGGSVLAELIEQSGLSQAAWLQSYFHCYLTPLIHCLYHHNMAFMPHSENLILIVENHKVVGAFMKDIAEEVMIINQSTPLPKNVQRISVHMPESEKVLSLFTDVFDGIFRYLAQILLAHTNFPEKNFWHEVASCIHRYQDEHPELAERFEQCDLFADKFAHCCLNLMQIKNNQQMVNLNEPWNSLQFKGTLENPIAPWRR